MTEKEQHYFEILLEDIKRSVEAIAEGHGALDDKMERFHKEAKEDHHLAMALIKHSYDELTKEIRSVDKRSEARDAALTAELKEEIRAVGKRSETRDTKLKEDIQAVDRKLPTEIRSVEHKVNQDCERESALGQKVEGHEDRIRFLERKVA